jgi:hypothetical protein
MKTIKHWFKKLKYTHSKNRNTSFVYGLEKINKVKCLYVSKQSTDSTQSLSKYQCHSSQHWKKYLKVCMKLWNFWVAKEITKLY